MPEDKKNETMLAVFVVPSKLSEKPQVLTPKHAFKKTKTGFESKTCEWKIPDGVSNVSMVGVVFSPSKLNHKNKSGAKAKINDVLKRQDYLHILTQLANYADLEAEVDTLKMAVSDWDKFPNTRSLDTVLKEFSSRYNVELPKLDTKAPANQQVTQFLRAVIPDLTANTPTNSRPNNAIRQTASVFASLTGILFGDWGSAVMGMTVVAKKIMTLVVRKIHFQPVIIQKDTSRVIRLYSLSTNTKPRDSVYLGDVTHSISDENPQM